MTETYKSSLLEETFLNFIKASCVLISIIAAYFVGSILVSIIILKSELNDEITGVFLLSIGFCIPGIYFLARILGSRIVISPLKEEYEAQAKETTQKELSDLTKTLQIQTKDLGAALSVLTIVKTKYVLIIVIFWFGFCMGFVIRDILNFLGVYLQEVFNL
ncbi:MAG: hypothetical protein A2V66_15560 [Ignavibacteria bacterium RBG_13_36_8]|nr:MAG: hypothetical protein A2V66_15560 [Ignavibacteria bacterium RBG_13_36_8]